MKGHQFIGSTIICLYFFFHRLFVRGLELSSYVYFWDNYRIVELPWDSAWTWWLAFFGVDFCYYWVHRCAHGKSSTSVPKLGHQNRPNSPVFCPARLYFFLINTTTIATMNKH